MPLRRGLGGTGLSPGQLLFRTSAGCLFLHLTFQYGYVIKPTYGASMVPTIGPIGDAVLISKRYRLGRGIAVGDLVNYENPYALGRGVIKRVIGMPGDFVLRDTPGVEGSRGMMLQVPEGHCWVAGDNQAHSRDSRTHGPVPLALVRGKVIARVLPFRSAGWFENTLREPIDDEDDLD